MRKDSNQLIAFINNRLGYEVDFRSPRRLLPDIQDHFNRKGLISEQGEKKKAFFILKKYYERK